MERFTTIIWSISQALKRLSIVALLFLLGCKEKVEIKTSDMKLDKAGLDFIRSKEGYRSYSYFDSIRWAIGYGNTFFEDGTPVTEGMTIEQWRAEQLFEYVAQNNFAKPVNNLLNVSVNQSQFNALVSLAYNIGIGNFSKSTLLKKVNANPNDTSIGAEFERWKYSNGRPLTGLLNRRKAEAKLYFSGGSNTINEHNSGRYFLSLINTYGLAFLIIIIIFRTYLKRKK